MVEEIHLEIIGSSCVAQVELCVFPGARDRLDCARGDEAVTGDIDRTGERKKRKEKIRAKGPVSLQPWYVDQSANTPSSCVTVKTFTHLPFLYLWNIIAVLGRILTICVIFTKF